MNSLPEWFWIGLLFAGIVLLVSVRIYATRSRRHAFERFAATLGLRVVGANPISREERKKLNLFSRGNSRKWQNILADAVSDPTMLVFDFSYTFGIPLLANVRYHQTVAAFSARMTSLPDFQLTPATFLDRAATRLGFQFIEFKSRPEFAKRCWLRTEDEIAVRALFTEPFLDRLAGNDPCSEWYVEKAGRWLIIYQHNKLLAPQAIPSFWQTTRRMAALFLRPS